MGIMKKLEKLWINFWRFHPEKHGDLAMNMQEHADFTEDFSGGLMGFTN